MFPVLKTVTIVLLAAALNIQAVVMPSRCDCQGTAWTAAPLCARASAETTRSCCAHRNAPSETVATDGSDSLPARPACLCCPSHRAEVIQDKAPTVDRSELVLAILPVPESLFLAALRVTDRELLARIWQDDTHGIALQARLSVWLN